MTEDNANSLDLEEINRPPYALTWYHGDIPRYCWSIRGIKPDRSFYGEITMFLERGGRQVNVTGKLSESDYARFLSLVSEVERATVSDDSNVYWDGLLAEGPVSHPRVILKFCHNENQTCVAGEWFLKIIDLLTPYMHQFYADVEGSTPAQ